MFLVLAVFAGACGRNADPLSNPEQIAGWANSASSLGVFTRAYDALAFTDGELAFEDPGCPARADDGTTATLDGDCTDSRGTAWSGSATIVRTADNGRDVTLSNYGRASDPELASFVSGTVAVREIGPDEFSFAVDVRESGGIETDIQYDGTVAGSYDGPTLWNGSGTVARDSVVIDSGSVSVETVDQLRDNDICAGQGISGFTRLVSPEHEVVVTYDGVTDCDDNDAARWSLDGEDQGLIEGVACSASGSNRGAWWWAVLLLVLWVSVAARPRRRRRMRA